MKILRTLFLISLLLVSSSLLSAQQGGGIPGGRRSSGGAPGSGKGSGTGKISEAVISLKSNFISVSGRLQPRIRIVHKSSVSGYVGEIFVDEGEKVKIGDHLFRIDRNDIGQSFKPVYVDARITGVVSRIDIQIYTEVAPGSSGITIVASDSYSVDTLISDKDAFKITIGQDVRGINPEGQSIEGTLVGRSQEPDYKTGLFSLRFNFPGKKGFYLGDYIIIKLSTDRIRGIFINRSLLVRRYGKYFLWIVNNENKLNAREIKPGASFGDEILIASGLEVGERYLSIISGKEREGMEIGTGSK